MAGWIIAAAVILVIVLYLLRRRLTSRAQREAVFMERMRSSDMYVCLYPVLVKTRECCVERILIRPEEVRIILYKPMNREYRFEFEAHGLDNVDRPAALRALAQAIALDMVQTQADLSCAPVLRPRCVETTAMGAAYLAGLAVGYWKNTDEIRRNWAVDRRFEPSIAEADRKSRLKGWKKAVKCCEGWAKE